MTTQKAREIDYEIVNLYNGLFDGPPPCCSIRPSRDVDLEVASLRGSVFDNLPRVEVPLDSFAPPPPSFRDSVFDLPRVEEPPPSRPRVDSLSPTAGASAAPPSSIAAPARDRRARTFATVAVLAAAMGVLAGVSVKRNQPVLLIDDHVWAATARLAAMPAPAPPAPEAAPVKVATTAKPAKSAPSSPKVAAPITAPKGAAKPADAPRADAPPPDDFALPPPAIQAPLPAQSIDKAGAAAGIAVAARRAAACLDADDTRTSMPVSVTFAPSGRVTRATLEGGPHRGTAAGSCIARTLRAATVGPFDGSPVTISTGIRIR